MKPFDSIENMTVERFYQLYEISGGKQSRFINVGNGHVIDLKEKYMYALEFLESPDTCKNKRVVERGRDHKRYRPTTQ